MVYHWASDFFKRNKTLPGQSTSHQNGARTLKGAKTANPPQAIELSNLVVEALEDAKAEDIVRLELDGKTAIADEMIIASGRSNIHVSAIADKLSEALKEKGYRDLRIEGQQHCDWVLVDAGDIIVHIFDEENREKYQLETLWGDAEKIE